MPSSEPFTLASSIRKHLEAEANAPKTYQSKPGLKPSELGSPCLRKQYYVYHKVPSSYPWEADRLISARAGDAFHGMLREMLKAAGLLVEYLDPKTGQVPLSFIDRKTPDPEFPIYAQDLGVRYAKVDGIVKVPDGERAGLWVLEIKSKASKKWRFVTGPDRDEFQGSLYAFVMEEAMGRGAYDHIPAMSGAREIQGTVYLYMNRDTGEMLEYWHPKDVQVFAEIAGRAMAVMGYVERGELPPKTQDFCNWCSWRDKCAIEFKVE